MNITLIYPSKNAPLFGVPLGIASIAAVLREEGHNVNIVDLRYQSEDYLFSILKNKSPKFIGIYSSTETAPGVLELGKKIKELLPDSFLVIGGPHSTISPEYFLGNNFDVAINGEGELTAVDLAEKIEKNKTLKMVKGITYSDKNRIIKNDQRPYIENLDSLPFPAYDLFPHIKETLKTPSNWMNLLPFTHVLVSRGCPYKCTFCQPTLENTFGKKVRRFSSKRVFELLKYLKDEYKIKEVFFEDDLLLHRGWKNWLYEWTDLVKENKLDIRWWGQSRADSSNEEILTRAKTGGCYLIMCGVESGSQKILDFYNKQITPEQVKNLFKICKKLDLLTIAEIIFGAPNEALDDAKKTVNLMEIIKPDSISICILTPYQGTYLYDWLKENNIRFEKKLDKIDRSIQSKKIYSQLTNEEIYDLIQKTRIAEPSMKFLLTREQYRKTYFKKIKNLLEVREYKKINHLILSTLSAPAKKQFISYYYKNPNSKVLNTFKKIFKYETN